MLRSGFKPHKMRYIEEEITTPTEITVCGGRFERLPAQAVLRASRVVERRIHLHLTIGRSFLLSPVLMEIALGESSTEIRRKASFRGAENDAH